MRMPRRDIAPLAAAAVALIATAGSALAHVGTEPHLHGFADGFVHPLFGPDHLAAMVAVGLWSATLGGLAVAAVPAAGLASVAADWLLLAETAAWNWATTETVQLLVQRPRPPLFNRTVNTKPLDRRSQYTSFWSGHTSYVAAMGVALACLARARGRRGTLWVMVVFALMATSATGAFRILEGRHFLFDVLAGGLAGAVVGATVFRLRRA